jgi:hypothetical protein
VTERHSARQPFALRVPGKMKAGIESNTLNHQKACAAVRDAILSAPIPSYPGADGMAALGNCEPLRIGPTDLAAEPGNAAGAHRLVERITAYGFGAKFALPSDEHRRTGSMPCEAARRGAASVTTRTIHE